MKKLNLVELRKHPEHYTPILDLFLQPTGRRLRNRCGHGPVVTFEGNGLDGVRQSIKIYQRFHIERTWISSFDQLPALSGRILSMLMGFGYDLNVYEQEIALRYHHFARTGLSNLHDDEFGGVVRRQYRRKVKKTEMQDRNEGQHGNKTGPHHKPFI